MENPPAGDTLAPGLYQQLSHSSWGQKTEFYSHSYILQTAYHFTKEERYKDHALNLSRLYGYEENACRPASVIGYVEGEFLSDGWNHSDDEMYFLTIPAFVKYAFDEDSRQRHLETICLPLGNRKV